MSNSAPGENTVRRTAVRALILTPNRELLLMQVREPASGRDIWLTPGGGIEGNEQAETALHRELKEETGLEGIQLGPLVWKRHHTFPWNGQHIDQQEYSYLVETARFEPSMDGNPDPGESAWFRGFAWWTVQDVLKSESLFSPRRLGYFLEQLVSNGTPPNTIDVGV